MKNVVSVLLVFLTASAAVAGLDPNPDSMGIYFDPLGNQVYTHVAMFTPFNVYLLLMNPQSATDGFECTVTASGAPFFILSTTLPADTVDADPSADGFAVGSATPFVVTSDAMIICTWQYMVQSGSPLYYYIGQGTHPSLPGGLPVVTGDGVLRRCGVASGDVAWPVAIVNPPIVDVVESNIFGSVKSLFR